MNKEKKDSTMLLRINKHKQELFKQKCKDNDTNPSKVIDTFIEQYNDGWCSGGVASDKLIVVGEFPFDYGSVLIPKDTDSGDSK